MSIRTFSPVLRASIWMGCALVTISLLAVSARELTAELETVQILFLRSVISLGLLVVFLTRSGWGQLRTSQFGIQVLRNAAHLGGQYAWITGLAMISMAEVFALEFTAPVWAMFIAAIFLGERINGPRILALVLGMTGVLIILRPGFIEIQPATLLVLFGAFLFAIAHTTTKSLVAANSPLNILFYMTAIHVSLSAVPALLTWQLPSSYSWMWLSIMACASLATHYCMSRAFMLADAMVVIPLDFLRLPLIALIGYVFYAEGIDWMVMLGAIIMFSGNLINVRAERNKGKKAIPVTEEA